MNRPPGERVHVLLVEDNPADARLLREMLRDTSRQFDITHVDSLSEGLQALDEARFDVVLLDLSLPDGHGLETFERMHAHAPDVPIVVLSGLSDELLAAEAVHGGAQDYLVKGQADEAVLVRSMVYAIERHHSDEALRESEHRYRGIVDTATEGIATLDATGRVEFANPGLCQMLGCTESALLGSLFEDWVDEDHRSGWRRQFALRAKGEWLQHDLQLRHRDGSAVWALVSASERTDARGHFLGSLLMATDVTQRKRVEAALEHQALHDALTDLPNRTLLEDRLNQAMLQAERSQECLALLVMDLDRFKEVNDAFGHQLGDSLLAQIGPRLQAALRKSDTIARLGGDEFAILLPGLGASEEARARVDQLASKITEAMIPPFVVDGQRFDVSGSIGLALCPEHGRDWQTLMRRADVAMYAAKVRRSGHEVYEPDLDEDAASRLTLTADLHHAVARGEMELHYQPKVEFRSGESNWVEALVRWRHPDRGLIFPDEFIGLAERTGFIKSLSLWVLDRALEQCAAWQAAGRSLGVAVNLSMRDLHDPTLPDEVAKRLTKHGLDARRLKLEITEGTIMSDPPKVMGIVTRLAELGAALSIDDFGTGYSSLAYIKRLPVQELKIDKSFVINMASDHNDAVIVRSTIDLAHNLGLWVVAEGVESVEAWRRLADLGCDEAQGIYLARPLPANEVLAWLEARRPLSVLSAS